MLGRLESDTGLSGFLLQVCGLPLELAAATTDVAAFTCALRALSGAILHIHSMEVVHLDIKPHLLSPRLSDLGIWRLAATDWMLADFDAALVFKRPEQRITRRCRAACCTPAGKQYVVITGTMEDTYAFGDASFEKFRSTL